MKANFKIPQQNIKATFVPSRNSYTASFSIGGGGVSSDYLLLFNKPLINGVELVGDKNSLELGLASYEQGLLADSALQPNDNISELVNNVGYITGITSSDIQTALGYIPYSTENPSGFITISALNGYATENWVGQQGYLTSSDLSGYATEQWVNNQGFIKGISNIDVINALGYTPYDNSNPAGYITSESLPTVNNSTITIQKNGSDIESFNLNQPTNETINITVPTQTSDLTNNSGFITNTVNNLTNYYLKSEIYTKTEVQNLISGITGITIEVVSELPASGENGVIYLVPKEGASPDVYNEYIWVETDEDYELIGNTAIDLTDYVQFTDLATVATTGDYDDLSNKPTIPTVGNGTITINQGGTQKGTFTTNQNGNTTIDLDAGSTVDQTFDGTSTNAQSGIAIKNAKFIQNTATASGSLTILGTSNRLFGSSINIGESSSIEAQQSIAIGYLSDAYSTKSIALGTRSGSDGDYSIAIGYQAYTYMANSAIQLGYGENSIANSLNIGFYNNGTTHYNWQLLDGTTGFIPDARLSSNIARTSDIGNGTITFTQGGVTKGTITTNQSENTTIDLDAGGGGGAVDSVNGQTGTVVLTASDVGALADTTTIPSKTSDLTNDSGFITVSALNGYATETWVGQQGYITGITSSDVTTALGYTPYNSTNPDGYITSSALNGYATETWVGNQGYLTGITSSDVVTALTYTPYNGATNPNGYITSADLPTNYVTTDTAQDISGRKTFLGEKAIYFKQLTTANKLGFTLYNPSNTELGALEYRPNTINGASLLALNCPQTTGGYVGFRYWGSPAVNIVAPKVATAGNYFIPTHITDGNTTVTASNTGTVNISTLLPDVSNFVTNSSLATTLEDYAETSDIPTAISDLTDDTSTTPIDKAESIADQRDSSSLKYWTGTKAQYDAIVTKDSDTIYNVEDTTSPIVDILNTLYPIGAIYIGTMATCPLSVLGVGTWQLVAQDRVLQGAGTRGAVGTTINESLPNIRASLNNYQNKTGANASSDSALYFGASSKGLPAGASSAGFTGLYFDASRSSSTYQDDAPVQQDGYLVNIWERIS